MMKEANDAYLFADSSERTNKLINSLRVGVLLHGRDTEILFSNSAALTMLGLTEEVLHSRSSYNSEWDIIHEDGSSFPNSSQPVPVTIKTKMPVSNVIMGVYRPITNDRIWLLVNAEPLLDENGDVKEVICSFSNITGRILAEEKLNWLYKSLEIRALELATSNAELESFLNVATHDLQEPLRLVSSFTELLKKKYAAQLDEQANEYISYAVEGAARMKKLILDLLEFSHFSNNKEDFALTDLNQVLQGVLIALSPELKESNAELVITELPVIYAKKTLITQLFKNLLGNSLKFRSDSRPAIQINYTDDGENHLFSIKDNGIGIDNKYADKIFVLFKRLHSNNEKYEGTGVGLAISKKIVQIHKGNIWIESEDGKGSTFYFTISKKQDQ